MPVAPKSSLRLKCYECESGDPLGRRYNSLCAVDGEVSRVFLRRAALCAGPCFSRVSNSPAGCECMPPSGALSCHHPAQRGFVLSSPCPAGLCFVITPPSGALFCHHPALPMRALFCHHPSREDFVLSSPCPTWLCFVFTLPSGALFCHNHA